MSGSLIEPGKKAPAFNLPDQNGAMRRLSDFAGKTVVLYFYPKDDTEGCTIEAQEFRDAAAAFKKTGAVVLGVSPDDSKSHCRFVDKYDLNFTLLADVPGKDGTPRVCHKYGVWAEKSMYGRTYMGVVRTTYIIGPTGKVEYRFDKVKPAGHAKEVLAALQGGKTPKNTARGKK